jgi:hypothetical protein
MKSISSLHRNADISSEYVQINAIKISCVVFGYMETSYHFLGRLQDGHSKQGEIYRRLQAWAARISVRLGIIHHGSETHNQAISAAGASRKTETEVRY